MTSRIDIAAEQLEVALELFLSRRSYPASLTLAGASEEIFGRLLHLRSEQSVLVDWFEVMARVHPLLHGKELTLKEFAKRENKARNVSKHLDSLDELEVEFDAEDAALWMLVRACTNYERLGFKRTPRMDQFDEWFYKNVLGL